MTYVVNLYQGRTAFTPSERRSAGRAFTFHLSTFHLSPLTSPSAFNLTPYACHSPPFTFLFRLSAFLYEELQL